MDEQEKDLGPAPPERYALLLERRKVHRLRMSLRWLLDEIRHEHCGNCDEYLREQGGNVDDDCGPLHYAVKQAFDILGDEPEASAAQPPPEAPKK